MKNQLKIMNSASDIKKEINSYSYCTNQKKSLFVGMFICGVLDQAQWRPKVQLFQQTGPEMLRCFMSLNSYG